MQLCNYLMPMLNYIKTLLDNEQDLICLPLKNERILWLKIHNLSELLGAQWWTQYVYYTQLRRMETSTDRRVAVPLKGSTFNVGLHTVDLNTHHLHNRTTETHTHTHKHTAKMFLKYEFPFILWNPCGATIRFKVRQYVTEFIRVVLYLAVPGGKDHLATLIKMFTHLNQPLPEATGW